MSKKRKPKMEYRFYKMPDGSPILALLGQKWVQSYGRGIDYLHFHNYMEIGYCYEGRGEMILGEESLRFKENQFSVVPKNYPHTTNSDPGTVSRWEYLFIDVEGFCEKSWGGVFGQKVYSLAARINSRAILKDVDDSPEIARMIQQILDIMRKTEEMYLEEAKGVLAALLVNIARKNAPVKPGQNDFQGKVTIPISRALDYITLHYMEPLTVKELADWCYLSETHFRRMFSSYMKMSPLAYVNLVRIQAAGDYLKKTDDSISDIAYKCGFPTLSTFNRNFKQVMGVSPREWRNLPENFERKLLEYEIRSREGW